MSATAIRVDGLGKRYRIGERRIHSRLGQRLADVLSAWPRAATAALAGRARANGDAHHIWAIKDVSFDVPEGEVVGIIGANGAGKSTLLKILSRITYPTEGSAEIRGRMGSLLEVGTGFHPELTGRDNVYLNGALLGMSKSDISRKFDEIVAFSDVEQFIDTPVKHYSSGMQVRLAFAVAAHLEPEILVIDEVLSVGDAAFQRKCLGKLGSVVEQGRTVVFVSHNMSMVQNLCRTAHLLDKGRVVSSGPVKDVVAQYAKTAVASNRVALAERTDREGDGRLRFVEFHVRAGSGGDCAVSCGEIATLAVRYEADRELRSVAMSIAVYDLFGDGVLYLGNELVGRPFDRVPASGSFHCDFAKLPLMPGTYSINLYCTANGVLADWVRDAARLTVVEGDYFGTGRLPPKGYGSLAVPHQWKLAAS